MEALLNSSGDLPAAITQHKHFPSAPDNTVRTRGFSSRNHFIRATAKRHAQSSSSNLCRDSGLPCTTQSYGTPNCYRCGQDDGSSSGARRPQLEKVLRGEIQSGNLDWRRNAGGSVAAAARRGRISRNRISWGSDEVEGRDLAHSAVPLPSDRFRLARKPTLEREEAFRDASTAKGNVRLRRTQPAVSDDADVAELYRMGLLYDDEQDCGEAFNLNSIEHEQPVYSVRPAKRSRKTKKSHSFSFNEPLYLDLSFTDLGGDQTIAQFLSSPPSSNTSDDGSLPSGGPSSRSFAPLRVIYELDGSQPSFDVDTSQPPDLVSDLLSDYDCFSDSDLDDLPSQREEDEVRDSAAAPSSDAWVVLGQDDS